MKTNKRIILVIFAIFIFLFAFDMVFGYSIDDLNLNLIHPEGKSDDNISNVCLYSSNYDEYKPYFSFPNPILIIYNDDSAYYNYISISGDAISHGNIHNWDKKSNWDSDINEVGALNDETKKIYLKTKECPDVLFSRRCLDYWYYLGYDENLSKNETWDSVEDTYLQTTFCGAGKSLLVSINPYTEEDMTECIYDVFKIKYIKSTGVVYGVYDIENHGITSSSNYFSISDSYKDNYNLLEEGKCPVIMKCFTGESYNSVSGIDYNYSLYVDELLAEQDYKGCSANVSRCTGGEYCDTNYGGICPTYFKMYEEISNEYTDYKKTKDINLLNGVKKKVEKLKSLCKSITDYSNYDSPCMNKCLNYQKDIENIGIISSNVGECTFSHRLIVFIRNILRWVKYIIPVAVIILGILDFIKAIGADKEDEMKKAQQRFIRRLIAAALIFLVPIIIEFVLGKMGFGYNDCGLFD